MIKAVIFDLGSVLASNEWPLVFKKIADEVKISEEKAEAIIGPLFSQWCEDTIKEVSFWKKFESELGRKMSNAFTKDFWIRTYKEWSEDMRGSWEILDELNAKKIRLALLSNIIRPHVLANEEMGRIERLKSIGFEAFIWSYELGVVKPNYLMYKAVLKKLNLPAESCVFVDDQINNVKAANKLGMLGIHFKNPKLLKKDLTKLNLL